VYRRRVSPNHGANVRARLRGSPEPPHQHHERATKAKALTKFSTSRATAPHCCYRATAAPLHRSIVPWSDPSQELQPKTKPSAHEKAEPIEETLSVERASLFSIGDAVHHSMFGKGKVESIKDDKLTITFEGNFMKVIREDFVIHKK
jgi:hypothetical protein